MATFTQLASGNWRVQVRRKTRYVAETFRRREDGEEWALEMERNIDRNGSSKPRAVRNVRTFGDLIDLHDEDMREVGKPPRRSKAAVMASLKTELGSVKLAERLADGEWRVVPDHLNRAARFEEANRLQRPVQMTVLSWQNLEALPGAVGATWLDRQLVAKAPETIAPTGMGSEVGSALRVRRQWLLDQRLAREQGGRILYARNLLQTLERRELA